MDFSKDAVDILISKVKNFLTGKCRVTGDKPSFSSRDITMNWYMGEKLTDFNAYACEFYVDNPTQSGSPDGILKIAPCVIDDNGADKCTSVVLQYSPSLNAVFRTIAYISARPQLSGPYIGNTTPEMVALDESAEGVMYIKRLIDIIGKYRFERIICAFNEAIPDGVDYSTDFDPELQDFDECRKRFARSLRMWATCHDKCLLPIFTPFEQLMKRDERVWYVHYPVDTMFVLKRIQDHETLDVYKLDSNRYVERKLTDDEVRKAFGCLLNYEINSMFKDIEKRKKESVDKPFIGEKISFDDKAPKKWVDLYTLLYDHFAHWCRRVGATLQQRAFSYSNRSWYPAGISFYIMKRNSHDGKDKLKFSVLYEELTEQVTMRFFAENVNVDVDGHNIHECCYCEPIISAFLFDKPKDGVKAFDITNGDNDNRMDHDWKPLDVLKAYFGDMFWDNIIEIFGKFIPKQTEIFCENVLKTWKSNPEYQFFDYIRYQFSKLAREWFLTGSVKQIIKSINAVDWEVTVMDSNLLAETNSFRKYRIQLRHLIHVKDSNGIADDNLAVFKIDPIFGVKRIIPDGLDHEFGKGFGAQIELIYNSVRMKISQFVKEEKKMNDGKKKELIDEISDALMTLNETLKQETHDEKTADPKYPHFSTDKNGQKLVTIPWDVYKTIANNQYGMAVTVVKDRRTEIKDAYWDPKTGVATIIWADGTKTMSKPMEGTTADPEIGFALCISKKFMGGTQNKWRKWLKSTIDASAASAKKKGDKSRVKLEKQARARLLEEKIDNPDSIQLEAMIETIKAENAAASEKNKPAQKKPGRKKKTN